MNNAFSVALSADADLQAFISDIEALGGKVLQPPDNSKFLRQMITVSSPDAQVAQKFEAILNYLENAQKLAAPTVVDFLFGDTNIDADVKKLYDAQKAARVAAKDASRKEELATKNLTFEPPPEEPEVVVKFRPPTPTKPPQP